MSQKFVDCKFLALFIGVWKMESYEIHHRKKYVDLQTTKIKGCKSMKGLKKRVYWAKTYKNGIKSTSTSA